MALPKLVYIGGGKRLAAEVARVADALEAILLAAYGTRVRPGADVKGTEPASVAYDDDFATVKADLHAAERKRQGQPEEED